MTEDAVAKLVEHLLQASVTGIVAFGVRQLQVIAREIGTLKVEIAKTHAEFRGEIAVLSARDDEHSRRLNAIETKRK